MFWTDDNYIIGIVPITCEELFKGIEAKKSTEAEYQVVLNMLEIYNEQVGAMDIISCKQEGNNPFGTIIPLTV